VGRLRYLTLEPRLERWLTIALVLLFWMQAALWPWRPCATASTCAASVQRADTLLQSSEAVILFLAGLVIWELRRCWRSPISA